MCGYRIHVTTSICVAVVWTLLSSSMLVAVAVEPTKQTEPCPPAANFLTGQTNQTAKIGVVEKLNDIEEIKQVKARYFRGVDFKSRDLLRNIFTDDVQIDYRQSRGPNGSSSGPVVADQATGVLLVGGDKAADVISKSLIGVVSVHHASIPEIEITSPTTARAIWPMVDRLHFGPDFPEAEKIGYGHYYETYEKVKGQWRIKTMCLTRLRVDDITR